ncbi:MAG: hypothetical protein ACOY4K_14740 [Pseudomonadota bacterium]
MDTPLNRISVSRLTAAEIDEVFWLARLVFTDLAPGQWRRRAKRWTAREQGAAGALIARDAAGRLVGLAPFEVRTDLQPGRSLWVEKIAAFSLVDARPVVRALADGLRDVARSLGCRGLKVEVETGDRALLAELGRVPDSARSTLARVTV